MFSFKPKKKDTPPSRPEPSRVEPPRTERPKPDPPRGLPPNKPQSNQPAGGDSMFSGMQVKQEAPAGGMFGGLQMSSGAETPTGAAKPSAFGFLPEGTSSLDSGSGLSFAGLAIKDTTAPAAVGFNFVNTSAAAESGGFHFKEAAAPSGGFNFVEQPSSSGLDFAGLSLKNQPAATNEAKDIDFAGLTLKNQDGSRRNSTAGGELDFAGMTLKTSDVGPRSSISSLGDDPPLDFNGLSLKSASRRASANEAPSAKAVNEPTESSEASFAGLTFKTSTAPAEPSAFSFQAAAPTNESSGFSFKAAVAAPTEPAPAKPTISTPVADSLESVQANADKVLINFFEETKALLRAEQETRQLEAELDETTRNANERLKSNEVAVLELIQLEDFEKADHINALVEQDKLLVKQTDERLRMLRNSPQSSNESLIGQVLTQLENYQVLMGGFYKEKQLQMETYVRAETNRLEEVEEGLQLENDRIERALEHTKVDMDKVSDELQTIEASIQADTKEVLLVKTEQEELKVKLDGELAELLRLLAEKKKEVADNEAALAITNEKLAQARLGHEKKLKRLGENKSRMVEAQQATLKEQDALNAKREALGLANSKKEEQQREYVVKLSEIETNRNQLTGFAVRLKAEQNAKRNAVGRENEYVKRTANLEKDLLASNSTMENLVATLGEKESGVADHQKSIMAAEMKIPTLEAEKAAKITKRDFLGAGVLSKEIKDAQATKSTSEDAIRQLKSDIEICKSQQEQTRVQQLELEKAIAESKVSVDRNTCQKLQERRRDLQGVLSSLPSSSSAVGQADRSCLELEISFIDSQLTTLRTKHNWAKEEPSLSPAPSCPTPSVTSETKQVEIVKEAEPAAKVSEQSEVQATNVEKAPSPSSPPSLSKEDIARMRTRQAELVEKISPLEQAIGEAIGNEQYETAAELDAEVVGLKAELDTLSSTLAALPQGSDAEDPAEPPAESVSETLTMHLPSDPLSGELPQAADSPKHSSPVASPKSGASPRAESTPEKRPSITQEPSPKSAPSEEQTNSEAAGENVESDLTTSALPDASNSTSESKASNESLETPLPTTQAGDDNVKSDVIPDASSPEQTPESEAANESLETLPQDTSEILSESKVDVAENQQPLSTSESTNESGGLDFGGLTLKTSQTVGAGEELQAPQESNEGETINSSASTQLPSNEAGSSIVDESAQQAPEAAPFVSDASEGLDFGGLTLKSPTIASVSSGMDLGGGTPEATGALDFGGLSIKSPAVPDVGGLDFGGLTIKSPTGQNGSG